MQKHVCKQQSDMEGKWKQKQRLWTEHTSYVTPGCLLRRKGLSPSRLNHVAPEPFCDFPSVYQHITGQLASSALSIRISQYLSSEECRRFKCCAVIAGEDLKASKVAFNDMVGCAGRLVSLESIWMCDVGQLLFKQFIWASPGSFIKQCDFWLGILR